MRRSSRAQGARYRAQGLGLRALVLGALALTPVSAQEPALDTVLSRAGAYVVEFQKKLSGVVAEEQYVQDVRMPLNTGSRWNPRTVTHRELRSDLLLVKAAGLDRWLQ